MANTQWYYIKDEIRSEPTSMALAVKAFFDELPELQEQANYELKVVNRPTPEKFSQLRREMTQTQILSTLANVPQLTLYLEGELGMVFFVVQFAQVGYVQAELGPSELGIRRAIINKDALPAKPDLEKFPRL